MTRKEEYLNIFKDLDDGEKTLIEEVVDNVVFLEEKLRDLKKYPFIQVSKSNPYKQMQTPASKAYKELMQSYLNAVKVLQTLLYRKGNADDDNLDKLLSEFIDD